MNRLAQLSSSAGLAALFLASFGPASAAEIVETCGGLEATIVGTDGDDDITGTEGDDVIAALGGDDVVRGGPGDDVLCGGDGLTTSLSGGPGNDRLIIATAGSVDGGPHDDIIDATAAPQRTVTAYFTSARAGLTVDLRTGTAVGAGRDTLLGVSNVQGTEFDDRLTGDDLENSLAGGDGNDHLAGGIGDDDLFAGRGMNKLAGERGRDTLFGGRGDDTMVGGPGNDSLYETNAVSGDDTMVGGPGDDSLLAGTGTDYGDAGTGTDYCRDVETTVSCESEDVADARHPGLAQAAGGASYRPSGSMVEPG